MLRIGNEKVIDNESPEKKALCQIHKALNYAVLPSYDKVSWLASRMK